MPNTSWEAFARHVWNFIMKRTSWITKIWIVSDALIIGIPSMLLLSITLVKWEMPLTKITLAPPPTMEVENGFVSRFVPFYNRVTHCRNVSVLPSGQSHPLPMLPWNRHQCTPGISSLAVSGSTYIPLIYHLYTTYILSIGWLYAPYHLLREPGNSIDFWSFFWSKSMGVDPNLRVCFLGMAGAHRPSWGSDHCVSHPCHRVFFWSGSEKCRLRRCESPDFLFSSKEHHEM